MNVSSSLLLKEAEGRKLGMGTLFILAVGSDCLSGTVAVDRPTVHPPVNMEQWKNDNYRKIKHLREKLVPVPVRPLQIPMG